MPGGHTRRCTGAARRCTTAAGYSQHGDDALHSPQRRARNQRGPAALKTRRKKAPCRSRRLRASELAQCPFRVGGDAWCDTLGAGLFAKPNRAPSRGDQRLLLSSPFEMLGGRQIEAPLMGRAGARACCSAPAREGEGGGSARVRLSRRGVTLGLIRVRRATSCCGCARRHSERC